MPKEGCKRAAEICTNSRNARVKQMRITIGKDRISTRAPNNDELSQDISFTKSDDLIKQNPIIFGRSGKNLTEWQQKVNEGLSALPHKTILCYFKGENCLNQQNKRSLKVDTISNVG